MALTTLGDLIERLQRQPAAPAVIAHRAGGAETWTAGELASRARALAAGLRQSGLAQDEIVGLLAPSQPEWVLALLAIVRAGAIALPLSEQITASELARILRHSGCRRICTTRPFVRVLEGLGDDRPGDLSIVRLDREDEDARRPPRREDDPALAGRPASGRPPEAFPLRADRPRERKARLAAKSRSRTAAAATGGSCCATTPPRCLSFTRTSTPSWSTPPAPPARPKAYRSATPISPPTSTRCSRSGSRGPTTGCSCRCRCTTPTR